MTFIRRVEHKKLLFTGLTTLCVAIFALLHRNGDIQSQSLLSALWSTQNTLAHDILFHLRMPRVLSAFVTGGLLALSGCLMQALLQNPLADPYILGVSGGAAVGGLLCTMLGFSSFIIAGSWIGSLSVMIIVWLLGRYSPRKEYTMLLIGITIASLCSAIVSILLVTRHNTALRGMLFWMMGDLSGSDYPIAGSMILIIGLIWSLRLANQLDVFVSGKQQAFALGVPVQRLEIQLYVLASLMTATAVMQAGCVGFIGLIIPHLLRLSIGNQHRYLLPNAMLMGGAFLILADTFSQIIFAPEQLPVGIMITLIGTPVFIGLLKRNLSGSKA